MKVWAVQTDHISRNVVEGTRQILGLKFMFFELLLLDFTVFEYLLSPLQPYDLAGVSGGV